VVTTLHGTDITLIQRRTYGEINELFPKGEIDLAFICTGPYALGREVFGFDALATPVVRGEPFYQSYLIVHKDNDFSALKKAVIHVHRHMSVKHLLQALESISESAEKSELRSLGASISAIAIRLESEIEAVSDALFSTVETVSNKIDANPYNIKEVLFSISNNFDIMNSTSTIGSLSVAAQYINRETISTIYTQQDLKDANQKGYEEGYKAAREIFSNRRTSTRVQTLDVT